MTGLLIAEVAVDSAPPSAPEPCTICGRTPGACADAGACPGTVVLAEDVVPMYADAEPEGVR